MAEEEEEEEIKIIMEEKEMLNSTLPQEIIIEILSWVPAKSLISSFKLVCKAWRNSIQDPDFIKMHLNRVAINGGGGRGRRSIIRQSGNRFFQLYLPLNFEDLSSSAVTKLKFDLLSRPRSRLVGSCNGLLCVSGNESIILLNPSTRKYKVSPKQVIEYPFHMTFYQPPTYGFGWYYDCTTTIYEYKVVMIVYFYPPYVGNDEPFQFRFQFRFQIDIYSMSSNSWRRWRKVKDIPNELSHKLSGVFLDGAVHWMGCKLRQGNVWYWDTIVSFDIRDEEFRELPMPPCADVVVVVDDDDAEYPYLNDDTILMNVRGCLGNAYFSRTKLMDIELEIWVTKKYGITESWTKEFMIRALDSYPPRELSGFSINASSIISRSITCSLTGDYILIEERVRARLVTSSKGVMPRTERRRYGRRVLYDMNKKKIDGDFVMIDMPCESQDDDAYYVETLVSLKTISTSIEQH